MTNSILKRLFIAFLGFGITMGIIFPFFASIFVTFKEGLYWWFVVSCLLAGASIGITNYYLLKKLLVLPLQDLSRASKAISRHDLTSRVNLKSDDLIGDIANNFNLMAETLTDIVSELASSSNDLHSGVDQICDSANEAKAGVKDQYDQTQAIRVAVEEMVVTSHHVSDNAGEASEQSSHAINRLAHANDAMQETIKSINDLAEAVSKASQSLVELEKEATNIGGVLDVIGTISEQTNLLALNAAIEAARAGDQGRGFAVVADEVRSLAQRTKESTGEIKQMIDNLRRVTTTTVDNMANGEQYANQSAQTISETSTVIKEIQASVNAISQSNQAIKESSANHAGIVNNIENSMVAIHNISEASKERSEQTHNRSQSLAGLANKLEMMIDRFKL